MGPSEFAFFQEKNHSTVGKENPFIQILPTENKGERQQFQSALQNSCWEKLGIFQQKIHGGDYEKYVAADHSYKYFKC